MPQYEVEFLARVTTVIEAPDLATAHGLAVEVAEVASTSPCPRTVPLPCGVPDAVVRLHGCTPRVYRKGEEHLDPDPGHQCVS